MNEARQSNRRRMSRIGSISFGVTTITCTIPNLSLTGATIEVWSHFGDSGSIHPRYRDGQRPASLQRGLAPREAHRGGFPLGVDQTPGGFRDHVVWPDELQKSRAAQPDEHQEIKE